jgi:hypothetical protein
MAQIHVDGRGLPTLAIPDAAGRLHDYRVCRAAPGLDEIAYDCERLDTGVVHRVSRDRGGRWRCSCGDSIYRRRQSACKHMTHVAGLVRLIDDLTSGETP